MLAADLRELGELQAARDLEQDILDRRRRALGPDHPDTLTSATGLAADLRQLGDVEAARALDQDTLVRRRRVLGEDHPDTVASASNLAADLRELGETPKLGRQRRYCSNHKVPFPAVLLGISSRPASQSVSDESGPIQTIDAIRPLS
jgi:hypothetical protein